jgi:hypothetical protein
VRTPCSRHLQSHAPRQPRPRPDRRDHQSRPRPGRPRPYGRGLSVDGLVRDTSLDSPRPPGARRPPDRGRTDASQFRSLMSPGNGGQPVDRMALRLST